MRTMNAEIVVRGEFYDRGSQAHRNALGKNVCSAAARVSDVDERNLHG